MTPFEANPALFRAIIRRADSATRCVMDMAVQQTAVQGTSWSVCPPAACGGSCRRQQVQSGGGGGPSGAASPRAGGGRWAVAAL
jgi:hypothetical protein